eukprot:510447_1
MILYQEVQDPKIPDEKCRKALPFLGELETFEVTNLEEKKVPASHLGGPDKDGNIPGTIMMTLPKVFTGFHFWESKTSHLEVVRQELLERGLQETDLGWEILWAFEYPFSDENGEALVNCYIKSYLPPGKRKINHLPSIGYLTNKMSLGALIDREKEKNPEEFAFAPRTFKLPEQKGTFLQVLADTGVHFESSSVKWVFKKITHRGVKFLESVNEIDNSETLVQEFVNVFLIDGYMYDLGFYVIIKSLDPLQIFLFDDILVRFCKYPFEGTLKELNENKQIFVIDDYDPIWTKPSVQKLYKGNNLEAMMAYFKNRGPNGPKMYPEIQRIISTLISLKAPQMLNSFEKWKLSDGDGFEILRFDFLIDTELKPKLMEINMSPNLHPKNDVDGKMKRLLIKSTLDLVLERPVSMNKRLYTDITKSVCLHRTTCDGSPDSVGCPQCMDSADQVAMARLAQTQTNAGSHLKQIIPPAKYSATKVASASQATKLGMFWQKYLASYRVDFSVVNPHARAYSVLVRPHSDTHLVYLVSIPLLSLVAFAVYKIRIKLKNAFFKESK